MESDELLKAMEMVAMLVNPGKKTKLDSVLIELHESGFKPDLDVQVYCDTLDAGLRGKNIPLAFVATQLAMQEQPLTLRGLFYRVVSAGFLPSTDKEHYNRMGRVLTTLREAGIVPFKWIVDNLRSTEKPSSWAGLGDFTETVQRAYRKDFWAELPHYVHIFCEKDAISGVLAPVTREFDVSLSPIRGYVSLSYVHQIAEEWNQIDKPIHAYYLGDFDPSGFDLERDLTDKLSRYCDRSYKWTRLGVNAEDFETFNLLPLAVKEKDRRCKTFIEAHGSQCAELDALPPTELRRRIREAITAHIPTAQWERLKEIERLERESFNKVLLKFKKGA